MNGERIRFRTKSMARKETPNKGNRNYEKEQERVEKKNNNNNNNNKIIIIK